MSLTTLALRFAAPVPDPLSFERYLFIGPHPDDIEIGAGATVARLTAMGKYVQFLICTDGRFRARHDARSAARDPSAGDAARRESPRRYAGFFSGFF